jgi:hypothetical protein
MVAINHKRIRGHSRRTRGAYDMEKLGILSLVLLGILFFVWTALRSGEPTPVVAPPVVSPPATSGKTTPVVPPPATIISPDQQALEESSNSCELWLAVSAFKPGVLGLFSGVPKSPGQRVAEPDLLVPIFDANVNEFSPWHDFALPAVVVMGLHFQSKFRSEIFSPGISALMVGAGATCSDEFANMKVEHGEQQDSVGVHRSSHATAGSFSYHYNFAYQATRSLLAGEELLLPCGPGQTGATTAEPKERKGLPIEALQEQGMCLDNLSVAPSTLPGVGRGAFSKHAVPSGHVIAPTPVIHFDRSQTEILEQTTDPDPVIPVKAKHGVRYTDKVLGEQLLLNYCFGHPDSNILLLPYAPAVNFINHSREKVNAVIRWSPLVLGSSMLVENPNLLIDQPARHGLFLEFVALRDISPGEEIFIDYGDEWIEAWEKHEREWKPKPQDVTYMTLAEFSRRHGGQAVRTPSEQLSNPYPDNLQTACFFVADSHFRADNDETVWANERFDCLRPCDIEERFGTGRDTHYTAKVYPMDIAKEPVNCGSIPKEGVRVTHIPVAGVGLADRPYTTDTFLESAFRHYIGVPDGLFPTAWNAADPNPTGDFITSSPLKPGQLEPARWKETGEIVTPHGYRLGMGSRVQKKILEYCNKIGITETLRKTTSYANGMEIDERTFLDLDGANWYLQRPGGRWRADMHWMSPGDEKSTQDWLEMLSEAGFDEILKGIGESMGFNGLVAFHGSFMGISTSTKHYIHYDIQKTGNKHFNIIIPLILANETGPELDVQDANRTDSNGNLIFGRYPYRDGEAFMLGDSAYHATSPVNYRRTKEYRLSATIFVADVTEDILDSIMHE